MKEVPLGTLSIYVYTCARSHILRSLKRDRNEVNKVDTDAKLMSLEAFMLRMAPHACYLVHPWPRLQKNLFEARTLPRACCSCAILHAGA